MAILKATLNDMQKPLVSVLIPVYGVEKYIIKCLNSVIDQTYDNLEIVFVDDCTPDNSIYLLKEKLSEIDPNFVVKIVEHDKNRGLAAARNTAVHNATGEFVLHLDSDDYIDPTTVEKLVHKLQQSDSDAVMYAMSHIYDSFSVSEEINIPADMTTYIQMLLERKVSVCMCGGIYKKSLYTDHNIYEIEGDNYEEDYVTKPRLLYFAKKVSVLNEPLYFYNHLNEGSLTTNFNKRCITDTIVTIETLNDFFRKVPDAEKFKESLNVAALNVKANLLTLWSIRRGNSQDWNVILDLFPDAHLTLSLGLKYYIIIIISKMKLPLLLRYYVIIGCRIKKEIKRLTS